MGYFNTLHFLSVSHFFLGYPNLVFFNPPNNDYSVSKLFQLNICYYKIVSLCTHTKKSFFPQKWRQNENWVMFTDLESYDWPEKALADERNKFWRTSDSMLRRKIWQKNKKNWRRKSSRICRQIWLLHFS